SREMTINSNSRGSSSASFTGSGIGLPKEDKAGLEDNFHVFINMRKFRLINRIQSLLFYDMALVHYRCSFYINPTIGVGFVLVESGVVPLGLLP
ncbi:MAG: hypothetical protein WBE34_19635, partial [Candidatus Nitrosopolaris sp.]